jgi:type IV pilus assembly protein PilA
VWKGKIIKMLKINRKGEKGFTLIELMIVVAIVGVLAVLAIYGVRKYIANAKTAEARATVGQIGKLAVAAYERESGTNTVVALGGTSSTQRNLCPTSSQVPGGTANVSNRKYQSQSSDWRNAGWACLKFNMDNPQYFMYQYVSTGTVFTGFAWGDLNGDSVTSQFSLSGAVDNGQARTAPSMAEADPEE